MARPSKRQAAAAKAAAASLRQAERAVRAVEESHADHVLARCDGCGLITCASERGPGYERQHEFGPPCASCGCETGTFAGYGGLVPHGSLVAHDAPRALRPGSSRAGQPRASRKGRRRR